MIPRIPHNTPILADNGQLWIILDGAPRPFHLSAATPNPAGADGGRTSTEAPAAVSFPDTQRGEDK